jgi:hypothetical protein
MSGPTSVRNGFTTEPLCKAKTWSGNQPMVALDRATAALIASGRTQGTDQIGVKYPLRTWSPNATAVSYG